MRAMHAQRNVKAHGGWFERTAAVVGDLGNPFYAEERQRDVWNEASALGLQVATWLGLGAATVMVWVGGASAVPYAVTMFAVIGVTALVTIAYARRLGVEVEEPHRMMRLRLVPYVLLVALFVLGIVRTRAFDSSASFLSGVAAGTAVAVAALALSVVRARRRERAAGTGD